MSDGYPSRFLPAAVTVFGLVFVVVAVSIAVSHFGFDQPVLRRRTQQPVSSEVVLFVVLLFGAAGCVLAGAGVVSMRANARRRRDWWPEE